MTEAISTCPEHRLRLGQVCFSTVSDVGIPALWEWPFSAFSIDTEARAHVRNRIRQMPEVPAGARLSAPARWRILQCVRFVPRWADNPVLAVPPVLGVIEECLEAPGSACIEMAWNRILIKNFHARTCDVFYPPGRRAAFADPAFMAGYRNMTQGFLSVFDSVLVHAAGVVLDSRTALFLGPDGAGKTSIAEMAPTRQVLSDDHVAIHFRDGKAVAHGTPFGRVTCGPLSAPVGAFFILEKASSFDIQPVGSTEFFQFLWEQAGYSKFMLPRDVAIAHLDQLRGISRCGPVFRLRFVKDRVDWDAIASAMSKVL